MTTPRMDELWYLSFVKCTQRAHIVKCTQRAHIVNCPRFHYLVEDEAIEWYWAPWKVGNSDIVAYWVLTKLCNVPICGDRGLANVLLGDPSIIRRTLF